MAKPDVDTAHLPTSDLVALAGLKLMIEVGADAPTAFDVVEPASRGWLLDFLKEGPGCIGPEPTDSGTLGRARAWQVEVGRLRCMAQRRGEQAAATFAALAAVEAEVSAPEWVEISDVGPAPEPAPRRRPSRPDSVVVTPVEAGAVRKPLPRSPGFLDMGDPWGLPLDVTQTQLQVG